MDRLRQISQQLTPVQDWPEFNAGDTVKISYKIKEGSKERTQVFQSKLYQANLDQIWKLKLLTMAQ